VLSSAVTDSDLRTYALPLERAPIVPNRRGGRSLSDCQVAHSEHPLRRCFASAYIGVAEFLPTMGHLNTALTCFAAARMADLGAHLAHAGCGGVPWVV
jgi:hypothetical protein